MSDLNDVLNENPVFSNQFLGNANTPGAQKSAEFFDSIVPGIREQADRNQEFRDQFGFHMSYELLREMTDAYDSGVLDDDHLYKLLTSHTISDNLKKWSNVDISPLEVLENYDAFVESITGIKPGTERIHKTNLKAVMDSFSLAALGSKLNFTGIQRMIAEQSGNEEMLNYVLEKKKLLEQQVESRNDYEKRNPVIWALKLGAQSSVYTGTAIAARMIHPVAGFAVGMGMMTGSMYNNFRDMGFTVGVSTGLTLGVSGFAAAVEQKLGTIAGRAAAGSGAKNLQAELNKKITGALVNKLGARGVWAKTGLEVGGRFIGNSLGEVPEEVLQKIGEIAGIELGKLIQAEGVTVPEGEDRYLKQIVDAGIAGFGSALALGVVGLGSDTFTSAANMRSVRGLANSARSLAEFKDISQPFFNGDLSPEDVAQRQEAIYSSTAKRREQDEARLAAEIKAQGGQLAGLEAREVNEAGEDVSPGVYRRSGGSLYTRIEDEKRDGGVITGSFRMGDGSRKTESNTYGAIDYRIENGVLTITDMNIADHRKDLTGEFFQDFAKKFADVDIQWNPATEADIALKEQLAANNRRGAGLNYFEPAAVRGESLETQQVKQGFDRQLAEALPRSTAESRMGAVSLLDRIGKGYGLDFDEFLDRLGFDRDNIFTNTPNKAVRDFNDRAAQYAKGPKGQAARGAMFKVLKKLDDDVKAVEYTVVYLDPKTADFSTVVHELKHAVDNFLEQADPDLYRRMMDAAGKYDPKSGLDETTWRKERSAYAWENYLQTGEAPTPELRSLFRQMVEWLRDIVKHLSGMRKLTPEQKAVFDELLTKADSFEQEAAQAGSKEDETRKDTSTAPGGSLRAASTLSGGFGEGGGESLSAAQGFTEEQHRGAMTPEQRRQWYADQKSRSFGTKTLQPISVTGNAETDLQAVYALLDTPEAWAEFNKIADDLQAEFGGKIHKRKSLKSWERAVRKIKGDEGASHITDINGMTLVVPTLERAYAIMDALSKRRETFVRGKDRYTNIDGQAVNYAHYRDFLLNVKLPSGGIVELQINTPQMLAAKEDMAGHTLYEITDQIHEEGKNISGDEQTEIDRLVDIADWKLYDAAFETVLEGASFNASSLDMRSELVAISDHFQEDGALARLLSEKTLQSVLLWPRNANGLSSQEINTSEESSNEGTTSNGLTSGRESNVSLENLGSVVVNSVPSTSNIDQARENVNRDVDRNVDSSGVPAIREQYRAAKKTEGYEDTKNVGGEEIEGRWVLVEAETPTASHDETTFSETQGFPSSNGKTINDRDYRNDRAAQEAVIKMAAGYDSRALEGVVITDDGVVISGNNRTMSGKRAAREGTDGKYISALEKKAKKYGFTAEQVREYQHPRLVFEVAANGDYSTGLFAQFNQSTRKAQSPMETAVKMSKRLAESPGVIQSIAVVINEHDTLSELYGDKKAVRDIFNTLEKDKLIGEYDRPQYVDEGGQITGAGEDLLESVMLGSVLDEGNIRGLQGARSIRQKLVRGITALVENKGMGAYSFIPEMNEAVGIALAVNNTTGKDGKQVYGTVQDYVKQQILPGMPQGLTVEKRASIQLAEALDSGGQKEFALWFGGLNASMSAAAKGQSELFTGGVESKESILDRYTGYREDLAERKKANQETLTDPAAGQAAKARAALDDAGIAKAEADGSLFQTTIDDEYFKAIETGDMETAQRLVDAQARKNGYISTDEYRMAHQAPSKGDYNLLTIKESGVVPDDYWTHPKYYQYEASEFESFYSITKALDLAKRINREPGMFMYRAVPKDVKEDSFRNGDWITPSKNNASLEGESIPGGYRLVSQRVLLKNIWWDGNSINEFGFDDGENYTYKNTKNNRKLNDVIVRDYDGKIVPPSKRFNYRAHEIFFQTYEELLEDAARYESAEAFEAAYKGQDRTEDNRRQTAEWLLNSEPITTVKDDEIKITGKGKTFIDNIDGYFKEHWGSTVNRGDQVILLTREGIRSSLHHGYGKAKINAFAAVPHIIQNGKVIDTQNNWKNRGYDSYTVAAPFKIGDVEYIGEVIVNQHKDGKNTFYLHEVTEKSKLRGASQAGYETSTPEGASIKIIVQFFEKVKQEAADFHAPSDADRAWFEAFWKDARTAAKGTTLFSTEEAAPGAPEQGDRAFLKDINRKNLADVLITLHNDLFAGQTEPVAPEPGEDRGAYDKEMAKYRKAGELKARINRELPNRMAWVGIAAKVANGEELSTADYNTLRGYLRESPRDYRALFADLMDRPEWGLNLTEMKDGFPDTPLSAPRLKRPDDMDAKNRERLAEVIGEDDPELARGIREGAITVDDPRIAAFEKGLAAGIKKADEAISAVEAEIAEDARKFAGAVQGRVLELYREFKEAEAKYQARTTELAQKIRRGQALTSGENAEKARLLTDFDAARIAFEDFAAAGNLRAEVREELARIDARYAERQRLRELQKKRNAVREAKRINEALIKRIVRKVSLKTVAHDQAAAITIVQSFFEPSLIAGVNHRLGTIRGPAVRELYAKWRTDADFREELRREAGSRAAKIGDILGKPQWDYISNQEKRDLIRMLPKQDWITKLNLKGLEQYREDLVPLDIKISGEGKAVLGSEEERIAREVLGDELYSRILNQPLENWTMLELAELAEAVDDLYAEGRENLRARNEARYIQYENYRSKLSDIVGITRLQINPGDSPEEQERKQGEIAKILGKYAAGDPGAEASKLARRSWLERLFGGAYFDANVRRVARILDNGKNGGFTNLLYWQENDAYNLRERGKMFRRLAVEDSMRKLGIKMPELFQRVTVKDLWGAGRDQVYTVEELLGMKLAARDELSRRAVVYGNLASETERSRARNDDDALLEQLADTAEGRFTKVTAAADAFFAQGGNEKYLKFLEAVARDYDGVYDRLNRTNIDVFNQPVWKVEHYFPMFRLEQTGGVNEHQEVKDLLGLAGATTQWTDNGMTQTRLEMGPQHQTAIELGLYTTWAKSLDRVEHFIAYAPYVRTLNMVFKSRDGKALMEQIQRRYGAGVGNYIKEYINEKANPTAENNRHASDNIVKALRGRTASAYLAWKISGVLKQLATSPWPYLQYMNPAEYAGACVRFYQNPKAMSDFIREKSVFMATRTFDPVVKLIREQQELNRNKALGKLDQFNNLGMKGLEIVDWACVAPGWLAVYNREMAGLQKANEGLAADQRLSMEDMEYEAVARADDVVRLTQPSSRDTDQAPMFKNTPQAMKAFLQFTQSLNVIWQNIRYDMPAAIREGQALQVVGCLTGYIMAGLSVGLLTGGLGGDDDDKKDDVAWQRKLLYYSFTQFTDAVPFIGDGITKTWEGLATGRWQWSGGDNLFPVLKEFSGAAGTGIKAGQKLAEGDGEAAKKAAWRAMLNLEAGFAYSLGVPQSGGKELLRSIGIGDGDGELGFNPGAFAGRR